ncbi:NAD(P)H-dependent oxidoreductase [Ralstonia insidiosa]|uniref:FMN dependent NADH:quinone oxidoreductase n=1 Tax=Ralstonia insidiosa TaxID=190721 RepID=A0A192A6C4_9RALS|nr:NAD(P)H-dependent oxidoreductase [Ralstonia insidiosa]ANJ75939.1 FMN-dependent NADH-azoreductase [Ralstonia insidiosa]KAB0469255.1 FMN-dependent NADH-azoreductase [Ralstonia insidiosa]MBY4909925.1 NAD(P)H-dependent oxidoreductase [Ralstonia insidiosa]
MTTLLHVAVSPRESRSHSRRAAQLMLDQLAEANAGLRIIERDLAATPLPHPDAAFVEASLMPDADRTHAHHAELALSETLIGELEAADAVLISTPVHNYTVPSILKAWIDLVVRPERTFRRTPTGKVGVLADRSVLVVSASGGNFDGAHAQTDFLMPYLRYVFATVGIQQVEGIRLQNTARGADSVVQAFEVFRQELATRRLLMPLVA